MALYLGLDGGGSRLRARVEDENGRVEFEGVGGPANWVGTDAEIVRRSLHDALAGCPPVTAAVAALAGITAPGQAPQAEAAVREAVRADRVAAVADYHAAWAACEGADVCVISGTGSLVCSAAGGRVVKTGGGGVLFGDEGSAASIGRSAVRRLGSGEASPGLDRLIETVVGARGFDEIVARLTGSETPTADLARLGLEVAKAACTTPCAGELLAEELAGLARLTRRHLEAYHQDVRHPRIALSGGLWDAVPAAAEVFGGCMPDAGIIRPAMSSVQGAVRLARQLIHEHGE